MTKTLRLFVAGLMLLLGVSLFAPAEEADAHIDWSSAFNVCHLVATVNFEGPTGYNWNVFRATDFNLFGHFGVGCTIHPAPGGQPTYNFVCFIYDRHTHELFWDACPTPP